MSDKQHRFVRNFLPHSLYDGYSICNPIILQIQFNWKNETHKKKAGIIHDHDDNVEGRRLTNRQTDCEFSFVVVAAAAAVQQTIVTQQISHDN